MLHLLNRSPQSVSVYREVGESFGESDHLLLIEDACYAALPASGELLKMFGGRVSVLEEDLLSRGLAGHVVSSIAVVDMRGFLVLTQTHERSVSWF